MISCFNSYIPTIDTINTTRILGNNPFSFNSHITKIIYPSCKVKWSPNAIILVPLTTYHYGLLASPIIHFPINAPLIFTNPSYLLPETLNEIINLCPTGMNVPAKVLIVGPISSIVENQLQYIGLTTMRITGNNAIYAAYEAMEFRYRIPVQSMEGKVNIMIVSAENYEECIPAAYYAAHMGVPILFTYRNSLPEITKKALVKYSSKKIFLIGSENTISSGVLEEIQSIVKSKVDRIGGNSPYEVAINFAKYYSPENMFGWNINTKGGWAFCFGTPENWAYNLAACVFAHLGKHSPLLYINPLSVPKSTSDYIKSIKPEMTHPPLPQFMHGFILGDFQQISTDTQIKLEEDLSI